MARLADSRYIRFPIRTVHRNCNSWVRFRFAPHFREWKSQSYRGRKDKAFSHAWPGSHLGLGIYLAELLTSLSHAHRTLSRQSESEEELLSY